MAPDGIAFWVALNSIPIGAGVCKTKKQFRSVVFVGMDSN
jgi:hypothetical protein